MSRAAVNRTPVERARGLHQDNIIFVQRGETGALEYTTNTAALAHHLTAGTVYHRGMTPLISITLMTVDRGDAAWQTETSTSFVSTLTPLHPDSHAIVHITSHHITNT
jgi:hypothetical protein